MKNFAVEMEEKETYLVNMQGVRGWRWGWQRSHVKVGRQKKEVSKDDP